MVDLPQPLPSFPDASRAGPDGSATVAFVLAGGQSRRMGQDKALLSLGGKPLISHALNIFRDAGFRPAIAGGRLPLQAFAPVVEDFKPELGPLAGLCAALSSTQARRVIFLPVDLPLIPPSLLKYLMRHAETAQNAVTVSAINGFAQTFPVVLDRVVLPFLKAELEAGRRGCFAGFQAATRSLHQSVCVLPVELLVQSGQAMHPAALLAFRWFLNVNTPTEFECAERLSMHPIA